MNAENVMAPEAPLPLSVCIVAHNEEAIIAEAIASVTGWASEVVVLDCESTDRTAEIAATRGAVVYPHPNILPEISKNHSFERATMEWVFCLDADELVPEPLWREIAVLISRAPAENGFLIPRRNYYFGAPLAYGGMYPNRQLRLFRRGTGRFPGLGIHERVHIEGGVGELQQPFDHHPYPTFSVWLKKLDFYTGLMARELAERGVPINAGTIRHHMVTRPMRRWLERLFLKRGVRDGVPGVFAACADLITNIISFLKYWLLMREQARPEVRSDVRDVQ